MKAMLSADSIRITVTATNSHLLTLRVSFLKGNDEVVWIARDISMGDSLNIKDLKLKVPITIEA